MLIASLSVCPCRPSQPCLKFVGKARSLLSNGAPERCFTQVGSGLTLKHSAKLEMLARDKSLDYYEQL